MTTMLEKMARALVTAQGDDYDALPEIGRRHAADECRAALLAIREPDEAMLNAAENLESFKETGTPGTDGHVVIMAFPDHGEAFTAMIDAILNEEKAATP